MPSNGHVVARMICDIVTPDGEVVVRLSASAVEVIDSGPGLSSEEAERLFERSLAQDSRSVAALAGLAELYFNRGAYARALTVGERAIKLAPDDAGLHILVGDAAFKVFRYDDARAIYERARALGHKEAARRIAKLDARLAD